MSNNYMEDKMREFDGLASDTTVVFKLELAVCGACAERGDTAKKLCLRGADWTDEVVATRAKLCGGEHGLQCVQCELDGNFAMDLSAVRVLVPAN